MHWCDQCVAPNEDTEWVNETHIERLDQIDRVGWTHAEIMVGENSSLNPRIMVKGYTGTPQLSTFSGDIPINNWDVSHNQWSYEVRSIHAHYSKGVLRKGSILERCCS